MKLQKVINGELLIVNAYLSHLKGNRMPYFSITGTIYKTNAKGERGNCIVRGCIHDKILKVFPKLNDLVSMHLADSDGMPMYALENGWYHLQQNNLKAVAELLRISKDKVAELKRDCQNKEQFSQYINSQIQRWNEESKSIIEKYNLEVVKG